MGQWEAGSAAPRGAKAGAEKSGVGGWASRSRTRVHGQIRVVKSVRLRRDICVQRDQKETWVR